jgi:hypothetical protein
MEPKDVTKCVEHIAAHPILGFRYGTMIERLPSAIRSVLGRDAAVALVFEECQGSAAKLLGVGMAVFVSDDFLREVKSKPHFWIGPELATRITRGISPLLSDAEVRKANSTVGLNLVVWHNSPYPKDRERAEVGTTVMVAFDQSYRGFRLKELIAQADCIEQLWGMRNAGGLYFNRIRRCYGDFPKVDFGDFSNEPHNVGISRELALTRGGSWVGSLFLHAPPQFGFSRAEQRQLFLALNGSTDEELTHMLDCSLSAVKKNWRMIYDRVARCFPDVVTDNSSMDRESQSRGKQKKQRLLDYLRKHPEELRPISRKLIQQASARIDTRANAESILDTDV